MRVLHIITSLNLGGASRTLHNLLSGGLRENHQNFVLSLRDEGFYGQRLRDLGVPVWSLNIRGGLPSLRNALQLTRLGAEIQPEVIQGWMYHGNLGASLVGAATRRKRAVVWNVRHSLCSLAQEKPLTRQVIRLNRFLSKKADTIIFNSQTSLVQHREFGFSCEKARWIPNGIDIEKFSPDRSINREIRMALGIPAHGHVVGHVARFHPMKDHKGFLKVAVSIADKNPDTYFLLVGREISLDRGDLAGIVPDRLRGRFLCLGEREDVGKFMQGMDVLCSSSAWGEGFPNVVAEAMATGVPCVVTDVGDSAELVGDTGRVVASEDYEAMANAIQDLISMSPLEKEELSRKARERISSCYSLAEIVKSYDKLYKSLAK